MVALVTYNALPPYEKGIVKINGTEVLVLPETFKPKSPANILLSDKNWQLLLKHKDALEKVIIFAGKKRSGALEIIDLACQSFHDKKDCLYFVLCWHELPEKFERLAQHGISEKQYVSFSDGKLPCHEGPLLKGYLHDYLDERELKTSTNHRQRR